MSLSPPAIARTPKSACFDQIQQLREFYGDEMTATLLGIYRYTLGFKFQQTTAVRRLAFILHRMTFRPGAPVSLFEILTCGKYDRTPQEEVANPAKTCENTNVFEPVSKPEKPPDKPQ